MRAVASDGPQGAVGILDRLRSLRAAEIAALGLPGASTLLDAGGSPVLPAADLGIVRVEHQIGALLSGVTEHELTTALAQSRQDEDSWITGALKAELEHRSQLHHPHGRHGQNE